MKNIRVLLPMAFVVLSALPIPSAQAWGPLGHRMVTETAALLLENRAENGWGSFLARHRFELGYYATTPDSVFRHKDGAQGKLEAETHYLDLEGLAKQKPADDAALLSGIPKDFRKFHESHKAITGSVPWRAEQWARLAESEIKNLKKVTNAYFQGKTATGDDQRLFQALLDLGVLAHYLGDSSMPYHSTADWDGVNSGQSGIHFYLESDCINALEPPVSKEALDLAQARYRDWVREWEKGGLNPRKDPIHIVLAVLLDSTKSLAPIARIDQKQILLKSGVRKNAATGCKFLRPILIERIAKGAALTAYFWDSIISTNKTLVLPEKLQFSDIDGDPAFIKPDYL